MAIEKKKKSLVDSLARSIEEEEKAIDRRFEMADKYFNQDDSGKLAESNPPEKKSFKKVEEGSGKKARYVEKVIRDGFSMPASDQQLIQDIRIKSLKLGVDTNKSEIVRAGLRALMDLPDSKLTTLLKSVPKIKTGRPGWK